MRTGLGHVEIASNKGDQDGIQDVVDEFVKNVASLAEIGPTALLLLQPRGRKPFNVRNLDQSVDIMSQLETSEGQHLP